MCLWITGDTPKSPTHLKSGCSWFPFLDVGEVIPRQPSPRCSQPSPGLGPRHRSESGRKEPREVQARSKQMGFLCQIIYFRKEQMVLLTFKRSFFG